MIKLFTFFHELSIYFNHFYVLQQHNFFSLGRQIYTTQEILLIFDITLIKQLFTDTDKSSVKSRMVLPFTKHLAINHSVKLNKTSSPYKSMASLSTCSPLITQSVSSFISVFRGHHPSGIRNSLRIIGRKSANPFLLFFLCGFN